MHYEERVDEMMKGRRQKRFPRVLLAVTDHILRRETMLALTRQRFVVDECTTSSHLIPKWEHKAKYDLVIVYLDGEKDTNAHFVVSQLRRSEAEPQSERAAVLFNAKERRLGSAPPIAIDVHPVIARVKYANDQQVPPTFVIGCYNTVSERTFLESTREEFTHIAKIPFSNAFVTELASWFTVADPILPLSETPTVAQVLHFVQQANRTRIAQGQKSERLAVNLATSSHQATAASIHYEHQIQVLKEDLAAAYAARDAAEEEASAMNQKQQALRAELEQVRQQADENSSGAEAAERLLQARNDLYASLETEQAQLLRIVSDDSTAAERHSDIMHVVGQCKKLRDAVFDAQSQLILLQAEYTSLEKRFERLARNGRRGTGARISVANPSTGDGFASFRPIDRAASVVELVKEESPHTVSENAMFDDDEAGSSSTSNPVQKSFSTSNLGPKMKSARSLRGLLRRESSIASVVVVEPVMQPSLETLERYENTIMGLHDELGRMQLCNAMQAASLSLAPHTPVNLGGTFLAPAAVGNRDDDDSHHRPTVDNDLLRQLMQMWNEVEGSIRQAEHDLHCLSAGTPSEVVAAPAGASRSGSPVVNPMQLAQEKGLLRAGCTELENQLQEKLKAIIDAAFGPIKEWLLQMHTGFRNILHDLALDGIQQFASDSKNLQKLHHSSSTTTTGMTGLAGNQQQVLNHTAKFFQRNIRKAVKGLLDLQLRNHQRFGLTVRRSVESMSNLLKPMLMDVRRAVASGRMKSESDGGVQTEKLPTRRPSATAASPLTPRRPTIVHPPTYRTEI